MDKPESFEVQEYNDVKEPYQTFQVIKQIVQDEKDGQRNPSLAWKVDFLGDVMKVQLTLFEMHLPQRMKEVQDAAHKLQKSYVSELKKEFKKRAKHDLKLKEIKDKADYTVQKVSLNERYYYICWHLYELDV
jgi:hypothetical protein